MSLTLGTPACDTTGSPGWKLAVIAALSIILSACGALPTGHDATLATPPLGPPVETFHLRGRAMLRQDQRVDHFRFDWQHSTERDTLLITSPFGQGVGKVSRDATGASLRLADGRTDRAESLETIAEQLFGTPIPLGELANWLRGTYPQTVGGVGEWSVEVEQIDTVRASGAQTTHTLPRVQLLRNQDLLLRLIVDERESLP